MVSAVIFDLDGVLVDSEPYWREGFRAAAHFLAPIASASSPQLSDDELAEFEGGRVKDTVARLATQLFPGAIFGAKDIEQAAERAIDTASQLMRESPTPIDSNVAAALELALRGTKLAVASSSPAAFIEVVLERLCLRSHIVCVESAYALDQAKPHPEVYLNVLTRMGLNAADVVAVEDSRTGAEAAVRAGIPTIVVNSQGERGSEIVGELRAQGGTIHSVRVLTANEIDSFAQGVN